VCDTTKPDCRFCVCSTFAFVVLDLSFFSTSQEIGWEERLRKDQFCDEWEAKNLSSKSVGHSWDWAFVAPYWLDRNCSIAWEKSEFQLTTRSIDTCVVRQSAASARALNMYEFLQTRSSLGH